jgi:outer membrane protein assembly factor BamB
VSGYDISTGDRIWRFQTGVQDAVGTPVIGTHNLYFTVYSQYGNRDMREQIPNFINLASEYDDNQDLLIDKEEITGFEFLLDPEKTDVQGFMAVADYFGMWDQNNDGFIDSTEWRSIERLCESFYHKQGIKAIKIGGKGDVTLDHFLWGSPDHVPHVTSPLFYDGQVYMIRSGGILSCFRADTGELLFRERIGATGAYFASPVAVNGKIYFASRNGIITVIKAGDNLNVLSRNDIDERISATPAIVDNKIYLRTANSLYAFGD